MEGDLEEKEAVCILEVCELPSVIILDFLLRYCCCSGVGFDHGLHLDCDSLQEADEEKPIVNGLSDDSSSKEEEISLEDSYGVCSL